MAGELCEERHHLLEGEGHARPSDLILVALQAGALFDEDLGQGHHALFARDAAHSRFHLRLGGAHAQVHQRTAAVVGENLAARDLVRDIAANSGAATSGGAATGGGVVDWFGSARH